MADDPPRPAAAPLRSRRWIDDDGMRGFAHRQRLQQMGLRRSELLSGRPFVAVVNTWSELSPCHAHLRERADAVKRGILLAGGLPFELPATGLGEVLVKPTTMLYRNLLAVDVEELLRSNPVDGAVLLGGCDKTLPGMLMGAISAGLPAIVCPAGPMLGDRIAGVQVGAGTHTRRFWDERQAGRLGDDEWIALEARMTRSPGTCNTMGTASTMAALVEALGLTLPGAATTPAMDAAHPRLAADCGERIVGMIREGLTPRRILARASFDNAAAVHMALGGSTNAVIHLIALARRAGVAFGLDDLDAVARRVPVLVDLLPSGSGLMEDFHRAGGVPALMSRLRVHLALDAPTAGGRALGAAVDAARLDDAQVIRPLDRPVSERAALAVLRGNLAPDGAVVKPSAASARLLRHRGRARVFDGPAALAAAAAAPTFDGDESTVLVLRGAGPVGAPGMPEWGNLPIPKALLARGVRDMLRISDARMSGTHGGTCVLHVSPESAVGGPLALVRDGDTIELDVDARRLHLDVSDDELARRRAAWRPPPDDHPRGWVRLHRDHVRQAHEGCDLDFLEGTAPTPEPAIY